jgi:hypothetical protein
VKDRGRVLPWEVARVLLLGPEEVEATIRRLEAEMRRAAANLEFERAARLRDQILELRRGLGEPDHAGHRKGVRRGRSSRWR